MLFRIKMKKKPKENLMKVNKIILVQSRACNEVFFTKTYAKNIDLEKPLGERCLNGVGDAQTVHYTRAPANVLTQQHCTTHDVQQLR